MKKIDVGQTITILANLGVIAGIVFLGMELRQNNELLEYDKRLSSLELSFSAQDSLLEGANQWSTYLKVLSGDELTLEDQALIDMALSRIYEILSWQFQEIPEDRERIRWSIQESWGQLPGDERVWNQLKNQFEPEFVEFFEGAIPAK